MAIIEDKNSLKNKVRAAVAVAFILGFFLGILNAIAFVSSNRYLYYKMYYLVFNSFSWIVNKYILIALGIAIFFLFALSILRFLLRFTSLDMKRADFFVWGLMPWLSVFTVGGYRINKFYLPGFFELKSIVGNSLWIIVCALLGWIILKASQKKFDCGSITSRIKTWFVLALVIVVLLNAASYSYFKLNNPTRLNLILVSIDTLRADHLSCYGYKRDTSPNIDRLAKDGVLFKNAIAQSSWTLPSHMSILTGLYSSSHGVITDKIKLSDEHITIAEVLRNAGYETAAFTDGGYLGKRYNYQGFEMFNSEGKKGARNGAETTYTKAVGWLRVNSSRSFFLFLHTYEVHAPFDPPPEFDIYSDRNYAGVVEVSGKNNGYYKEIQPRMDREDYLHVIDKYDGEIYYTDYYIGELFRELKALGLYDKTVIVITSDHGEHFLDHPDADVSYIGHFEHQLYDEIVKVPLIIKAPGFPQDKIVDAQVETIDIMPTSIELLGVPIPKGMDGKSLVESVNKSSEDKGFAFSEKFSSKADDEEYRMIRSKDWKLLLGSVSSSGHSEIELYNIASDPREQNNIFSERAEIGKSMFAELETWIDAQKKKSALSSVDKIELDEKLKEQLKALGYMN